MKECLRTASWRSKQTASLFALSLGLSVWLIALFMTLFPLLFYFIGYIKFIQQIRPRPILASSLNTNSRGDEDPKDPEIIQGALRADLCTGMQMKPPLKDPVN